MNQQHWKPALIVAAMMNPDVDHAPGLQQFVSREEALRYLIPRLFAPLEHRLREGIEALSRQRQSTLA